VLSDLARSRMLAGDLRAAVEAGREAMDMAEALGLKVLVARILCTIGTSRATLGEQEGIADLERSIQLAREIQSLYVRWNATVNLATVLGEWGELDRVAVLYEDPAIRDPGNESDRRWVLVERANYSYHAGDWEETEWLIDAFEESADPGTPHYMEFAALDLRARLALARGAPTVALEATAREIELTRAIADPQALLVALGTRSKCLREVGRVGDAEPLVGEIMAMWRASDVLTGMTAALDVAWTLREVGRGSEMLEIIDATGWRSRWFTAAKYVLRGELVEGAEVCQRIGSLPEEAEARLRAAEELPLDEPERSEHARRALSFYRRVRASALIGRSEALLTSSA